MFKIKWFAKVCSKPLLLSAVVLAGCADDGSGPALISNAAPTVNDGVDRSLMLGKLADQVYIPAFVDLQQSLQVWQQAQLNYCAGIGGSEETQLLASAQQSWRLAMQQVQYAALINIGPAAANENRLMNDVYGWPAKQVGTCRLNVAVVDVAQNSYQLAQQSLAPRGLENAEFLLFEMSNPAGANYAWQCSGGISQESAWLAGTDQDRRVWSCQYSAAIADVAVAAATDMASQWQQTYRDQFVAATDTSAQLENVQAVIDALFYTEIELKDTKLGIPTGLNDQCRLTQCAYAVESSYSAQSLDNISQNLQALEDIIFGQAKDGSSEFVSFDNIIENRLYPQLNTQLKQAIDQAQLAINDFSGDLYTDVLTIISTEQCVNAFSALDSSMQQSCALYGKLKVISDLLKIDFTAVMNVNVPNRAEGDGD